MIQSIYQLQGKADIRKLFVKGFKNGGVGARAQKADNGKIVLAEAMTGAHNLFISLQYAARERALQSRTQAIKSIAVLLGAALEDIPDSLVLENVLKCENIG